MVYDTTYLLPLTSYILLLTTHIPQSAPLLKFNNITVDILGIDKRQRANIINFCLDQFANPASAVLENTIKNSGDVIDPKSDVTETPSVG